MKEQIISALPVSVIKALSGCFAGALSGCFALSFKTWMVNVTELKEKLHENYMLFFLTFIQNVVGRDVF